MVCALLHTELNLTETGQSDEMKINVLYQLCNRNTSEVSWDLMFQLLWLTVRKDMIGNLTKFIEHNNQSIVISCMPTVGFYGMVLEKICFNFQLTLMQEKSLLIRSEFDNCVFCCYDFKDDNFLISIRSVDYFILQSLVRCP